MSGVFKFAIAFLLLAVVGANTINIKSLLKNVPEKDRVNFLKHYVGVGFKLDNNNQSYFPSLRVSNDAAIALYRYVKKHYQLLDEYKLRTARTVICFPDGTCIDVGDVGVHPKI